MLFPFLRPELPEPDAWTPQLAAPYARRYFSNFGPLATTLAERMAGAYLAPGYAGVLVASATAGLTAVLQALDLDGRKVALPDFTFAATVQAVFAAGAVPVVCDIDPRTWELSPDAVAAALDAHPDIACVLHVRPFGLIRDLGPIRALCGAAGLPLVVDAAAGLGAPTGARRFGSPDGEIEVFSMHATKVFAVGEGGFVAAPRERMAAIKAAMNFGFAADRSYGEGANAKFDEFRAAIGLAMLERMDRVVAERRRHAALYDDFLAARGDLRAAADPGPTPWASYPVALDRPVTPQTLAAFADAGIEIKKYYWPGVARGYRGRRPLVRLPVPVSEALQERTACLPVYSDLTPAMGTLLTERIDRALVVAHA